MGDAGPCSPSPAEAIPNVDGARQREVTVLVTGFGVSRPLTKETTRSYVYVFYTLCGFYELN